MNNASNSKAAWLIASAMALASAPVVADPGAYLGVSVGDASAEVDGLDNGGGITDELDGSDTSVKVFGGYMFNDYLGVEGAYIDFGNPDDNIFGTNVEAEITGYTVQAIGSVPVGPVNLFGKVGMISYDADVTIQGLGNADENGEELAYGVGAEFNIGSFAIRGEYEIYDLDDVDVDMISIGAVVKF